MRGGWGVGEGWVGGEWWHKRVFVLQHSGKKIEKSVTCGFQSYDSAAAAPSRLLSCYLY